MVIGRENRKTGRREGLGVILVRSSRLRVFLSSAVLIAVACKPTLDETTSIVTEPRVLAVRVVPAEAAPKDGVQLFALVADPMGTVTSPPLDWAYCDLRKPLAELGPVSPYCLARDGFYFTELGAGAGVTTTIPDTACREFGPEVPVAEPGQPAGRPVDPDLTGGYYLPLRLALSGANGDVFTLERARLNCGLAGATQDELADYAKRYHPNTNPEVDALAADGVAIAAEGGAHGSVAAGARVVLHASWATCADPTKACTGAETYPLFDLNARALVDRREAMRTSWFATAGSFDADHTGRDSTDATTFSENTWTAPSGATTVHVWIVVRDERGGTGWKSFVIDVH
jgi:hypothetical protein